MTEKDLVAFKLGFSSSWMMGNYTITVKILSQQQFADSHIDSNQDPSEVAPLDVNLAIGGNTVELGEFESCLHYLLGIKQGGSCLLDWASEVLGASALCHLLEVENLVQFVFG